MSVQDSTTDIPTLEAANDEHLLKRGLKARHLNMIAIGGAIGTGLFVASGASISTAGPGGALLAYAVIGLLVYFLMQGLGEMATYLPVPGAFETYSSRFISPSFGFAMGWNYWFNWAITVAAELAAAALVMKYWLPDVPAIVWSALFLAILSGLNYLSARAFGEGEFWFSGIKVVTVLVFLVVGVAMIAGMIGGASPGFSNWTVGDAPFPGGFPAILSIFMVAGFSFQGTELVGIAAGESEDPETNVPKAIRTVFFRIMLFYIGAITIIAFLLPYTDPRLLGGSEENIAVAPFTLVFDRAGIAFAAALMNAIILTSILSAGNSGLYASTRMLYSLAKEGRAPALFGRVNRRGVPTAALVATASIGMAAFLSSIVGDGAAYTWLVSISGLSGFIAWLGIAWCHYNFRRAYLAQGFSLDALPFKARFFPLGPILALVLCLVVILGQGYEAVVAHEWGTVIGTYAGLPVFLALWFGHQFVTGTRFVKPMDADLSRTSAAMAPLADQQS